MAYTHDRGSDGDPPDERQPLIPNQEPVVHDCTACGESISALARHCPHCGHPQPANVKFFKNLAWVMTAVVLAIFLVISTVSVFQGASRAGRQFDRIEACAEIENFERSQECFDNLP